MMRKRARAGWLPVLGLLLSVLPTYAQNDIAARVGIYHWLGKAPAAATAAGGDEMTAALPDLQRFGVGTVRVFVGGRYDYLHPKNSPQRFSEIEGPVRLAKILALPRYRQLFENPQFRTVWLTAYPVHDYGGGPDEIDLRRRVSGREWKQEARQMREMVEWLYQNFSESDKVVLLSNHEADEKLREILDAGADPKLALDNVVRNLRTRFEAVEAARRKFPRARLKVLFGVEIALRQLRLRRTANGTYEKTTEGLNALESVLPRLRYDFVSFSSWEAMGRKDVDRALREALEDINRRTRGGLTNAGKKQFGDRPVLVGEFGYSRQWSFSPGILESWLAAMVSVVRDALVPYAVYWQLYDDMEGGGEFGLIDPEGNLTQTGRAFLELLRRPPAGHSTAIVTMSEVAPPMRSTTGTAGPVGASAGTGTLTW
ncbi:MAG TPA: hypothetical protein VNN18_12585 [Candidatus Xenobia bacterium]|nr:hypothetical protein [Candidatus Xenobia bacterium]